MGEVWMRRSLWALVTIAAVVALAWALYPRPTPVDVGSVMRGPFVKTIDDDGKTRVRERYVVSAPLAGCLLRIELDPGDAVGPGSLLATLVPAHPALLDARTEGELTATAQALQRLGDGYRVDAHILVARLDNALQVPVAALFHHGDAWAVFALAGGRARLTDVRIGPRNAMHAIVKAGLAEGAKVIVYPADAVHDGARVTPPVTRRLRGRGQPVRTSWCSASRSTSLMMRPCTSIIPSWWNRENSRLTVSSLRPRWLPISSRVIRSRNSVDE